MSNKENRIKNKLNIGKENETEISLPPSHPIFPLTDNDKKNTLSWGMKKPKGDWDS